MLDLFRKRGLSSVVYSVVMGAIVVAFIFTFRPAANDPVTNFRKVCVAKVRGTCIEEKEWKAQRFLLRSSADESTNTNKTAVDSLVERTLLEQEASRLGVHVVEDDVVQEVVRGRVHITIPSAMRPNARKLGISSDGVRLAQFGTKDSPFDQKIFERTISQTTGQTADEFTESQERELVAFKVLELVAMRARVGDEEAWTEYKDDKSTSTIRYVRFVPAYFSEHFVAKDTAAIDAWASAHAKEVDDKLAALPKDKTPVLYHPRHILIASKKDDADDKKKAAKDKANALLAKVVAGEDFAALARENSEDPGSKDKGGEYDWTTGDEYVQEFKDGLAKQKVGETAVVQTQFGFHVLQVMARYDGKTAIAQPLYAQSRGAELAQQAADRVSEKLKTLLPVKLDDAMKAKIEDAKKSGKSEADATMQVVDDETRARTVKAIDDVLTAMALPEPPAPKVAPKKVETPKIEPKKDVSLPDPKNPPAPKEGDKTAAKTESKKDDKPVAPPGPPAPAAPPIARWRTDERMPHIEESSPFNATGSPVIGLMDQQSIVDAAAKLTKDAPLAAVKAGGDIFLLGLKDRHDATREEFAKEKAQYVGTMLGKKREDAVTNYLAGLREGLGKELFIDPKYTAGDKDAAKGQPAQAPDDDGQ